MTLLPPAAPPAAPQPRRPAVRAVVEIVPARAGCSELHLECGHVVRRRLAFCPPSRILCPHCKGG